MSVVAAAMTLDEQKTILKTCGTAGGDHSIPDSNEDENHILHKLKTTPSFAPSATATVTTDGGSISSVMPPASPQITINNNASPLSASASASETSYTAQHRRLLEGI